MPLLWMNPETNNRFANKHLYIIPGSPSLQQLVDDGYGVFNARIMAYRLSKDRRTKNTREAKSLKTTYGANDPVTRNTLLVLSPGGLQGLGAAIIQNGYRSGWYSVRNGVIFNMTDTGYDVGLVADLQLGIRACRDGYEVWHLEGANISVPLQPSSRAAKSQTTVMQVPGGGGDLGMHFTPTTQELNMARAGLRKTGAPASGGIAIWALQDITGVDLSFLDEDC